MRTVLITGARAPVALDIARAFAAAGWRAHLADSAPARIARASRTPAGVHRLASPRQDPGGFRRDLAGLLDALDPALVVPTCEEVFHLAAAAQALGAAERLFAPRPDVLRRLHAKSAFAELCVELGLDAPPTWRADDPETLGKFAAEARRLVFKPEWSRFGARALVRPGPDAVAALRPTADAPWVVQEAVAGDEACFYAVCRDGRLTAFSSYAPSWRLKGGAGYAFAPLAGDLHARLRRAASTLASVVGTGQFACDAVVDANGRPWLIECNPRATSGAHLFARAPALAHAMTGSGGDAPAEPVGSSIHRLAPAFWLFGLPAALAGGRLGEWRAELRAGRDVIGAPADPLPLAGALMDSLDFTLRGALAGRSLAEQTTADIEWNGEPL